MKHQDFPPELNYLSERVIGAAIEVHRELGPGYPEIVYESALGQELESPGIPFSRQLVFKVAYKGNIVGERRIDLLVDSRLPLEIKAVDALARVHEAQLLGYLRALNLRCGLSLNFNAAGLRDGIRRMILPAVMARPAPESPHSSLSFATSLQNKSSTS